METMQAISPVDGQVLGVFEKSSEETIRRQMNAARAAAAAWSNFDVTRRVRLLSRFSRILADEADVVVDVIMQSTGKVRTEALLGEVYPLLDLANYYRKDAERILRYRGVPTSPFGFPGATAGIERRPYGVVAVISPWNYPFQLTVAPILSALFAGNAVIFKMSELSLPVGALIGDLFDRLDLPVGLVQAVIGDGRIGELLIDAGPDLVFFTGGLAAGRAVMRRAARHPIPVMLELGGKDPMLVFADADLARARDAALYGAFSNSGQACIAVERLYVERDCYEGFVGMLIEATANLKIGQGPEGDLGAMTSPRQIAVVEEHYRDALAQGAKASGPLLREGNYLKPVVLWDVHHGMRVMREETFGPLLPVMPFTGEDEAWRLANDNDFGLNASIWSRDIPKARRIASRLQVGNWAINDVLKNAGHGRLPFGGVKKSGFGRYHGAEGLRSFTYPVSGLICRSRLPKEPNWFPYSAKRYAHFKDFLDFVYGEGSLYRRIRRNWPALQAFREYSVFDLMQRWQNLRLMLPWNRDY